MLEEWNTDPSADNFDIRPAADERAAKQPAATPEHHSRRYVGYRA
jgi:hypothetical protein